LKDELKKASSMIAPRIKMLIEIKKKGDTGISKRMLADLIGVNHNCIQSWRTIYQLGGLALLKSHKKIRFKPSIFEDDEREKNGDKLKDPSNGLRGYKELLEWIRLEFDKEVKYNTLLKYCIRNFKSSAKVARKSHVNKDNKAVEAFKKTSAKYVAKPLRKRKKVSKQ
jgi:hypothetical protein